MVLRSRKRTTQTFMVLRRLRRSVCVVLALRLLHQQSPYVGEPTDGMYKPALKQRFSTRGDAREQDSGVKPV